MNVVTRIAPSPTGYLHFGLARTALFSYLFAKQRKGKYILRIEDTDATRNQLEYETDIHDQFAWLGLIPDAAYKQSEHVARHTECLKALIADDRAYISHEPAKDDAARMVDVVRLRNPGERISFSDLIRGEITFDTAELGDFVIARSITEPLYHLAVVIDDHDEDVTHVIRGEDHISNTQRHILIQRALGFDQPVYGHLPLILMPDKSKMSKRREGSSVKHYRDRGILRDALINYIALLGWNPGTEQEIFSLEELVQVFDIAKIQRSGAVFNEEKLGWYNRVYLARRSDDAFLEYVNPVLLHALSARGIAANPDMMRKLVPLLRERVTDYADLESSVARGEYDCFFRAPAPDPSELPGTNATRDEARAHIVHVRELWSGDGVSFDDPDRLKNIVWEYATECGRGKVLWPVRFALSGRGRSPDPFMIASIIGRDQTLERLDAAAQSLSE